jgi:excisionase family DNA binding protein
MGTGMNSTMICRFCTLKEAAERLDATQDQIEDLLRKGILREFRDGSRRLLRAADVAAIAAARDRRIMRRGRTSQAQDTTDPFAPEEEIRPGCGRSGTIRAPRSTAGVSQAPRRGAERPETPEIGRKGRDFAAGDPRHKPASPRSVGQPGLSGGLPTARRRMRPETKPPQPSLSVREWFWTGLTQDRPVTIALFSTLVLLVLSALAAGAYMLADIL